VSKFEVGEEVRIKDTYFEGHHRTTEYVKGKSGKIIRYFGNYENPEILAYGGDGKPYQDLYWVQFNLNDLWEHKPGEKKDKLNIEIYDHWIEAL